MSTKGMHDFDERGRGEGEKAGDDAKGNFKFMLLGVPFIRNHLSCSKSRVNGAKILNSPA